ncbi:MAG: BA14K family protein [Parvibaculaceae bacterium]
MRRMILAKCMGAALAAAVMAGFAGQASAGPRQYCDSYARDVAHRKTNGGADVLVGTIGGALTGALVGGLIDRGEGAGKGAIIGGVGGTLLGAGVTSDRHRRAYANAYERCMDNYEGQRVRHQAVDEGGGRSWTKACARKYRSFNPQTGKYKTASGKWKPCRL